MKWNRSKSKSVFPSFLSPSLHSTAPGGRVSEEEEEAGEGGRRKARGEKPSFPKCMMGLSAERDGCSHGYARSRCTLTPALKEIISDEDRGGGGGGGGGSKVTP